MTATTPTDKTVLITGGAGFIGSHIADEFVESNDVYILDDFSTGRRENVPDGAEVVEGDVRDEDLLADLVPDADIVFHEAAVVSVEASVESPLSTHAVTADGTLKLLEAARDGDPRVVLASSAAIYGDPETVPIPETAPTTPGSPYGVDKLTVDHYARVYADLYGLETVALRYFNVYGPRQVASDYSGVISIFLDQAQRGDPITVEGDGTQTRDFVHVSDVVQANVLAATTEHTGEAYNVATGDDATILDIAETIRDVTDSSSSVTHVPPREGDIEESIADISKARDRLGFEPTVTLEEGLESLAASSSPPAGGE